MTDTEKILAKLDSLTARIAELAKTLPEHDRRLANLEKAVSKQMEHVTRQQATIDELTARVRELAKTDAVWRSRDKREVGIDRDAAYGVFRDLGYDRSEALRALLDADVLKRSDKHLTRNVRRGRSVVRAVVIYDE